MLQGTYSFSLVAVSALIAVAAAYTAIIMARHIASMRRRSARIWLAGGSLALGTGIWAMHFVGMLAFSPPVPVKYAPGFTLLSWLVAVCACAVALKLTTSVRLSPMRLAFGALVLGGAISSMHYIGMAAMRMKPSMDYQPGWLLLSIGVAVAGAGAALFLIHILRWSRQHIRTLRLLAALVLGASISGMHYVGMQAVHFPLDGARIAAQDSPHSEWLAILVVLGTLSILAIATVATILDQRLGSQTAALAASLSRANRELTRLALHDSLTKLPNRSLLEDRLEQAAIPGARFALIFLDLNDFKVVNDAFGHQTGDLLLVEMAQRLNSTKRPADTVARLGGDEFVLLVHTDGREAAEAVARRLIELVRQPMTLNHQVVQIAASLGIALYPQDATDPSTLMAHADAAMYHAKASGYGGYSFFESGMHTQTQNQLELCATLPIALRNGEFMMLYQPKYNTSDGSLRGVEALLRWKHPTQGMLTADAFIPLAERSGFILELGNWALEQACKQLAQWHQQGLLVQMAVNLSLLQFSRPRLVDDVQDMMIRHQLPPGSLALEVTESIIMQDPQHSQRMVSRLKAVGVDIAIDDFGSGYCNLLRLKRLPAAEIKIDRHFMSDLTTDHDETAVVSAMIALGKELGLVVTAEGVETEVQRNFLTENGCDLLQGYFLGRPAAGDQLHRAMEDAIAAAAEAVQTPAGWTAAPARHATPPRPAWSDAALRRDGRNSAPAPRTPSAESGEKSSTAATRDR